jgi:paraquat-inducible protein A
MHTGGMSPVIVCPSCDLAHRDDATAGSRTTCCARCRAPLHRLQTANLDTAIAVAVSALVLFWLSNAYPLVALNINGSTRTSTLIGAARGLFDQGFVSLGVLVLLSTVIFPLMQIVGILYLLLPLRRRRRARLQRSVFRLLMHIRTWTFVEVFMLGSVVALVRLTKFAEVVPGIALLCCGLLMMTLAALSSLVTPPQFWRWVERSR